MLKLVLLSIPCFIFVYFFYDSSFEDSLKKEAHLEKEDNPGKVFTHAKYSKNNLEVIIVSDFHQELNLVEIIVHDTDGTHRLPTSSIFFSKDYVLSKRTRKINFKNTYSKISKITPVFDKEVPKHLLNVNIVNTPSSFKIPSLTQLYSKKRLVISNRSVIFDKCFQVKKDEELIIKGRAKVTFKNKACIIVRGSLRIEGGRKKAIVEFEKKGMIIIQNSKEKSIIVNAQFIGGTPFVLNGLNYNGVINVIGSSISIDKSIFSEGQASDYINLRFSKFNITRSLFENNSSDAIDCDNAQGSITQCQFHNIKGDAIDFYHSQVQVEDAKFNKIGDKALSCGENSHIKIKSSTICSSRNALVSKNGSKVEAEDISFKNNALDLSIYNNEKIYAKAFLNIENSFSEMPLKASPSFKTKQTINKEIFCAKTAI